MSMDDGDFIGGIIEFIMDMIEMGTGLLNMAVSMGRKKRSLLEGIIRPPYLKHAGIQNE
ncbi:hypothetical protein HHI36_014628 [Cryptolaemus montrouzieri]|uniref:Uncharacterized protein n=1 Tax=Cryptolaemus montrouzieri TaxID=559131 RepID=A0ABD2N3G7_9CUCU